MWIGAMKKQSQNKPNLAEAKNEDKLSINNEL
jgi:hypothetical protein